VHAEVSLNRLRADGANGKHAEEARVGLERGAGSHVAASCRVRAIFGSRDASRSVAIVSNTKGRVLAHRLPPVIACLPKRA